MLDPIFGANNFRNEIIWCYDTAGRTDRVFNKKHDSIFWYSKSHKYSFVMPRIPHKACVFRHTDENGRRYRENTTSNNGKTYRYYYYEDERRMMNDWWSDLCTIASGARERNQYPTQKPEKLLERIILASTLEDINEYSLRPI